MSTSPFAKRFLLLRLLCISLIVGAVYDLVFAVLMVAAPEIPARILKLPLPPLPEGSFYLWIMATFLLMLAVLYLAAARDPRRYSAVIVVAAGGRILGALVFAIAAWRGAGLGGLVPLAAADLAFGVAHLGLWWPLRS